MKRVLLSVTIILSLFLTSCLKDNDYVQTYVELGNLIGEDINDFQVETDYYNILKPQGNFYSEGFKFKKNGRVIIQYSIVEGNDETKEYKVNVNAIENIFEKKLVFLGVEGADTLKKDPLSMVGAWIGKEYLNIEFNFRSSGSSKKPHYFDLVYDSTKQNVDNHLALDLTHNAQEDIYSPYHYKVIMTVPLDELKVPEQDSINIWLRTNDELYEPKTITYRYNIDK